MLLAVAAILAIAWLLGFTAFHVTSMLIHVLIIAAIIAVVAHFLGGRRTSAGVV